MIAKEGRTEAAMFVSSALRKASGKGWKATDLGGLPLFEDLQSAHVDECPPVFCFWPDGQHLPVRAHRQLVECACKKIPNASEEGVTLPAQFDQVFGFADKYALGTLYLVVKIK